MIKMPGMDSADNRMDKGMDAFCSPSIYKNVYYSTRHSIVVYSIKPVLPGHSMIIPKRHVVDIVDLQKEEAADIFRVAKKVIPLLLKAYNGSSYNFTAQIGRHSGMTVYHIHFHIIPRNGGDSYQVDNNSIYDKVHRGRYHSRRMRYIENVDREVRRLRRIFRYRGKR